MPPHAPDDSIISVKDRLRALQMALARGVSQDSPLLEHQRDQIFSRAEADALKVVRAEREKGTEGQIRAIVTLVDLSELEEIVGKPVAERRSTYELNLLRTELGSVAEKLTREVLNFDLTSLSVKQALVQSAELSGWLQALIKIVPLFETELGRLRENLERCRYEISLKLDHLWHLESLLAETLTPALWEEAVQSNNFEALDRLLYQMQKLDPNLSEMRRLERRLSAWKESHAYLLQEINEVKRAFNREDFLVVLDHLRQLSLPPDQQSNRQLQSQLQVEDYKHIHNLLSSRLNIIDIYGAGQNLVGWEQVEQAAFERRAELELWEAWDKACERLMDSANEAYTRIRAHASVTTLLEKRRDWRAVQTKTQAALDMLNVGAQLGGRPILLRSRKAKELSEEGKRRQGVARNWLSEAQSQLEALDTSIKRHRFPTAEDLSTTAQQDWDRLEWLVEGARAISATNPATISQQDWDRLEWLLERAHAMSGTNPDRQKQIEVYIRMLKDARQLKVIQTSVDSQDEIHPPPPLTDERLVEQQRVLDAALPQRVPVNRATELVAMVRLPESGGLRLLLASVQDDEIALPAPFRMDFPRTPEGQVGPASLMLEVEARDFEPQHQRQILHVPPTGDSGLCIFQLTPKVSGQLRVTLRVLIQDACIATCSLQTSGEFDSQGLLTVLREVVSIPLTINVFYSSHIQTGGVTIDGEGDVTVEGDVAGRDHKADPKITENKNKRQLQLPIWGRGAAGFLVVLIVILVFILTTHSNQLYFVLHEPVFWIVWGLSLALLGLAIWGWMRRRR